MGMSSPAGIARDYFRTLVKASNGKISVKECVKQIGVPIALGVVSYCAGFRVSDYGDAIAGIAIVSALMCAVATLLFQIRVTLREQFAEGTNKFLGKNDLKLVDELFAVVLWAILFGLFLVLLMILVDWLDLANYDLWSIAPILTSVFVAGLSHFVLVIGVVLKRLRVVYGIAASSGE